MINDQVPTAELRPRETDTEQTDTVQVASSQTDEVDMMPYPILNRIEQLAIIQGKNATEMLHTLQTEFPEHDETLLVVWIDRFFTLWFRNQWKRKRYAMSFFVDDESWPAERMQMFPVLSGNNR